jgi:hypothetical protein
MSGLLFAVGAVAVVVGAVLIGFGIPINEFSFGNTLIIAGTTAAVGGLIVIGLGVVVAQLQRIAEALATRTPIRSSRPLDMFDSGGAARSAQAPGRIPFPPKPKSEPAIREPYSSEPHSSAPVPEMSADEGPARSVAPTLRNPDEPAVTVDDDISLSPQHPMTTAAPAAVDLDESARHEPSFGRDESAAIENRQETRQEMYQDKRPEPTFEAGWRPGSAQTRQPHTAYFDAMWPADTKPVKSPSEPEIKAQPIEAEPVETISAEPEMPKPRPENEPRAVAILKSGVVDGMGYTLYVDGSIEAELPQGTLRFASITELRSHLEKNA